MAGPSTRRCGTCELLARSSTPGLATYGKCPHRPGWVRVQDAPCDHHQGETRGPLVTAMTLANLAVGIAGATAGIVMDVRHGTLLTHVLLAAGGLAVLGSGWAAWRTGSFSEEAKYLVLEAEDPPPEVDRDVTFR
ncbi:MAG: hypothetical protein HZB56_08890 [Deltaproteobacteria bacterium]|nr:hypothetical protein [Deltaproteobacteria bacterium]